MKYTLNTYVVYSFFEYICGIFFPPKQAYCLFLKKGYPFVPQKGQTICSSKRANHLSLKKGKPLYINKGKLFVPQTGILFVTKVEKDIYTIFERQTVPPPKDKSFIPQKWYIACPSSKEYCFFLCTHSLVMNTVIVSRMLSS